MRDLEYIYTFPTQQLLAVWRAGSQSNLNLKLNAETYKIYVSGENDKDNKSVLIVQIIWEHI